MMIAIALAALVAAPVPRVPAPGEFVSRQLTDAELRDRVDTFLRTIDVPVEREQWLALGPRAAPLLEQIARDPSELPTRRAQAVTALAWIGGARVNDLLAGLAASEAEPLGVKLAAVRGLATEAALRPLLQGSLDVRVRAVAAEQLVEKSAGKACDAVVAHAAGEDVAARPVFARAVARCAQR